MNLTGAYFQRLTSDSVLAGMVDEYRDTPAIFTDDRTPSDFPVNSFHIVTPGNVADEAWDTKTSEGRRTTRDIIVYGPHRSTQQIEAIAERVRELFHRHQLDVDGYGTVVARCTGPIRMSSDDYDARIVTVRSMLVKEPTDA